jgi:predicted  nucleic acid-binding Zn-ribbon protein
MDKKLEDIVAKTPEAKKIAKLEKELAKLKEKVAGLEYDKRKLESSLSAERSWRQDFQRLMKSAVQEDNLTEYERRYW